MLYGNILGERLRKLRKQAHMSQAQLANRMWLTKAMISNYELGVKNPSIEMLVKLACCFHVSTDYLLGIEKTQNTLDVEGLTEEDISAIKHVVEVLRDKNNPDHK